MMRKIIIKATTISIVLFFAFPAIRSAFADTLAVPYLCELGVTYYKQGRYDEAIVEFNKALMLDPINKTALQYINDTFTKEIIQENIPAANAKEPSRKGISNQQNYHSANIQKSKTQENTRNNTFYITAAYDINHIHYSEWNGENKLDEDYGNQNGYYVTLGYKGSDYSDFLWGKLFIEGYFRYCNDLIKYKGSASNGINTVPFNYEQKSTISRFGIKLGGYRNFLKKGELVDYIDIGERLWHRGENGIINGVVDYLEKYKWLYFGIGLGINYELLPRLFVGLDGEWMPCSFSPTMHSDLYEGGRFKLQGVRGAEVKIPIKYYLLKNLSLDLTPYFTYWQITKSLPVEISGIFYTEPDSKTKEEGLLAGLTYIF